MHLVCTLLIFLFSERLIPIFASQSLENKSTLRSIPLYEDCGMWREITGSSRKPMWEAARPCNRRLSVPPCTRFLAQVSFFSAKTSRRSIRKTRDGCGCFWDLLGGSRGNFRENFRAATLQKCGSEIFLRFSLPKVSWNLAWNFGEIFRATFSRVWVSDGKFHQNFTAKTVWRTEDFTQISLCRAWRWENSGKIAGKIVLNREMLQILGFRTQGKANLPQSALDLKPTFRPGVFFEIDSYSLLKFFLINGTPAGITPSVAATFPGMPRQGLKDFLSAKFDTEYDRAKVPPYNGNHPRPPLVV